MGGSLWGLGAETDQSRGLGAEATWEQLGVCGKASEAGRRAQKQIESAIKHKRGGSTHDFSSPTFTKDKNPHIVDKLMGIRQLPSSLATETRQVHKILSSDKCSTTPSRSFRMTLYGTKLGEIVRCSIFSEQ